MSSNLIPYATNMNYTYTALVTALISDPSLLRNGISNKTPIVHMCDHTGWTDFRNDNKHYIFFFTWTINDWILCTPDSLMNQDIILHGGIQFKYNVSLMKTNASGQQVPIQLKDVLEDPLSKTRFSNEQPEGGATLYDYALTIKNNANPQTVRECPVDVRLIKYNNPVFYEINYNLVTSTGQVTVKRSIVGIMKFKKANGEDHIAFFGTAVKEFIAT